MFTKIILILNLFIFYVNCSRTLGVSLERASLYEPSKPFACLDGSAVVPFEHVNDDYCDCRDGSDEPGTSACVNGSFTCENHGFVEQTIPSSRVNDGICDCCDGSDELKSAKKCENTCDALASKAREENERSRQLLEVGVAKKNELLQKGLEIREALQAKLKELEAVKANLENEKRSLEDVKNEAEAKAKESTDAEDKIFEEEAKIQAAIEKEKKSNELFDHLDKDHNGVLTAEELEAHNELDVLFDNDGLFTLEESKRFLDHRGDVTAEVFYQHYYDKLAAHIVTNKAVTETPAVEEEDTLQTSEEPEQVDEDTQEHHDDDAHHDDVPEDNHGDVEHEEIHGTGDEHKPHHRHHRPHTPESSHKPKYNQATQELLDRADKARSLLRETENKLRSVDNELSTSKRKLEYDDGPNHEFTSLIDECFEYDDREYVYKLCPFEKSVQRSKSNHGETSIGTWSSWDESQGENKYKAMKYENGLSCWNGPARSTKVWLSCGIDNKITAVSEPNRCEYEMKFETPCACNEADLQKKFNLGDQHDEL